MQKRKLKRKYIIRRMAALLILTMLTVLVIYLPIKYTDYRNKTGIEAGQNTIKTNTVDNTQKEKNNPSLYTEKPVKKDIKTTTSSTTKKSIAKTTDVKKVTYIKGVLIVNKKIALPSTYNPGTNKEALTALKELQKAAKEDGYTISLLSGFRSYHTQEKLYNSYVKKYGQRVTDTFSARPGHSEHQTGLAFDIGAISDNFGNTKRGKWLAENAYKYGFVIRYPKGKEKITGYKYEPWHVRYLGKIVARKVYTSKLCLEEYLGIN